jgi:hypothetical protein
MIAALVGAGVGCSRTPEELGTSRPSASAEAPYAPLQWDAPEVWTLKESPSWGPRKAVYRVAPVGDDKDEAEVMVMHFGTGAKGDVEANYEEWYRQFDGDPKATATHWEVAGAHRVRLVEWSGTYKVPMGPDVRPGRPAMQVIKQGYRIVGGVVLTEDRGNWFFRLVGPDATVQAAKPDFVAVLESAR